MKCPCSECTRQFTGRSAWMNLAKHIRTGHTVEARDAVSDAALARLEAIRCADCGVLSHKTAGARQHRNYCSKSRGVSPTLSGQADTTETEEESKTGEETSSNQEDDDGDMEDEGEPAQAARGRSSGSWIRGRTQSTQAAGRRGKAPARSNSSSRSGSRSRSAAAVAGAGAGAGATAAAVPVAASRRPNSAPASTRAQALTLREQAGILAAACANVVSAIAHNNEKDALDALKAAMGLAQKRRKREAGDAVERSDDAFHMDALAILQKHGIRETREHLDRGKTVPPQLGQAEVTKLRSLHPERTIPIPTTPDAVQTALDDGPNVTYTLKDIANYVDSRKTSCAPGNSGLRNSQIKALMDKMTPEQKASLVTMLELIGNGRVPRHWHAVHGLLMGTRGVALAKAGGGIRPVGISEVLTQIACGVMARRMGPIAAPICEGNLGVNVSSGAEVAGHTGRALTELVPKGVLYALDVKNAFNEQPRARVRSALLDAVAKNPDLLPLLRAHQFMYDHSSTATYTCPVTGTQHVVPVHEGVIQGNALSSIFFSIGHAAFLRKIREAHPEVTVLAYHDDTSIFGLPSKAGPAFDDATGPIITAHGQTCVQSKSHIYCKAGLDDELREWAAARKLAGVSGVPDQWGLVLAGTPIGTPAFMQRHCAEVAKDAIKQVEFVISLRQTAAADRTHSTQLLYRFLRYCTINKMLFTLRVTPPSATIDAASQLDSQVQRCLRLLFSIQPQTAPVESRITAQSRLPVASGGLALTSQAAIAPAAYLASFAACALQVAIAAPDLCPAPPDAQPEAAAALLADAIGDAADNAAEALGEEEEEIGHGTGASSEAGEDAGAGAQPHPPDPPDPPIQVAPVDVDEPPRPPPHPLHAAVIAHAQEAANHLAGIATAQGIQLAWCHQALAKGLQKKMSKEMAAVERQRLENSMPSRRSKDIFGSCSSADAAAWLDAAAKPGSRTAMTDTAFACAARNRLNIPLQRITGSKPSHKAVSAAKSAKAAQAHSEAWRCGRPECKVAGTMQQQLHSLDHAFLCHAQRQFITNRHTAVLQVLTDYSKRASTGMNAGRVTVQKEPYMVGDLGYAAKSTANRNQRADLAITVTGMDGSVEKLVVDLVGTHPGAGDAATVDMPGEASQQGHWAEVASQKKVDSYTGHYNIPLTELYPFAFETGGLLHERARDFISRVTRLVHRTYDPQVGRVVGYDTLRRQLVEQISVAVQTQNARVVDMYLNSVTRRDALAEE